ncbi:MAG TPA: BamA/TamA family outer membrane protein, partial [Minicystis sp.]|nr:BamA/TamA family outer membrane protein [Minicystis sp.]
IACALALVGAAARADEPPAAPAPKPAARADEAKVHLRYQLEGVEVRGNKKTLTRVVLRYVRFHAGDALDVNDPEIELTRYRLLGTGFFSTVQLSLRKGSRRGTAVLVIDVVERNTIVVQNLWLGIAADEDTAGNSKPTSAFLGVQAAETNLAGTGITLGAGIGLAQDQIALRARFEDPAFAGTKWAATAGFLYNNARDFFGNRDVRYESPNVDQQEVTDYAVVAYKRIGGTIGTGRYLSVSTSFALEYRLEAIDATVPTVASQLRGNTREPIDFSILPGRSALSTLRGTLTYDTRNLPFLPTRGTLASAALTVGAPPLGSDYGYVRVELSGQRWFTLPWGHVLRLSAFVGAVAGDAPFFEKFYVGDFTDLLPDRVLDLAPDRRQPPNLLGTDIVEVRYGDYAAQLMTEYRVPLYTGKRSIYAIDAFGAFGLYGVATRREFTDPPSGYSGLARVPVDLTYNLGLRVDTSVGGATIAFSNLLGLLPAHNGVRQ